MVRLTVSDDGPGMETAIQERIFEPFFTTKPVDQGTGPGLAVVHGIVQAHHVIILADSQPGNGAVFTIYLPPADCCTEHTDTADVYSDSATTGRPAEDHKLVYIDDDPAVMNILCRLFEGRGIRVSGFTNQQLALDYIRNNADTIDVVVTDNNMPGMQGLDVARAIREIDSQLPVAVIFQSCTEASPGFVRRSKSARASSTPGFGVPSFPPSRERQSTPILRPDIALGCLCQNP